MDIYTFQGRTEIGKRGEAELRFILEQRGYITIPFGQENYLNNPAHEQLRHIHDDPTIRAIRFAPDFIAIKGGKSAYWDSKVNTVPGTPNFTIEKADYQELMARYSKGERCNVGFRDTDGTWHANSIENLSVAGDLSAIRHLAHGSMTPFLLIRKSSTLPLHEYLDSLEAIKIEQMILF